MLQASLSGRLTCFLVWLPLVAFSLSLAPRSSAHNQVNISIPVTASQIEYTPFICRNSSPDNTERCEDAWQVINLNGTTLVSTHGPAPGSIIPQMFLQFRASTFYLSTSPFSNATTNLTVSNSDTVVSDAFNSSVGMVSVLDLPEAELSTVVISFVPDKLPTRLDISSITLTVTGNLTTATSVFLPTMTLPPTATLPIFSSAAPSTPIATSSDNHKLVADAVGITIGLSLGLTAVVVLGYLYWRRRRRRRPSEDSDNEVASRPSRSMPPPAQSQNTNTVAVPGRTSRTLGPQAKQNRREKNRVS